MRGAIGPGTVLPGTRARSDASTTGQGRKDAGLGERAGSGMPEGVHIPVLEPCGAGGALREEKAMEPIGGGGQVDASGAEPPEQCPAHEQCLRPPLRGLPASAGIGGPEPELVLELIEVVRANDPVPEHLDDHGARVPAPRMHPRREDADRALAGSAEVAPNLEVQPDPPGETENLPPVGAVTLELHPATVIAGQPAAVRMRARCRTT